MEREPGIEPAPSAWKAEVLPLNYSRTGPCQPMTWLPGTRWTAAGSAHAPAPLPSVYLLLQHRYTGLVEGGGFEPPKA